jgi:hypothetical protein
VIAVENLQPKGNLMKRISGEYIKRAFKERGFD